VLTASLTVLNCKIQLDASEVFLSHLGEFFSDSLVDLGHEFTHVEHRVESDLRKSVENWRVYHLYTQDQRLCLTLHLA
jgi:hypothetical protein